MSTTGTSSRALVFGARGQIGRFLLPRLCEAGWSVHAVTRDEAPAASPVHWHRFDLFDAMAARSDALPEEFGAIFSLGPLDGFAQWYERSAVRSARIVATSSTSAASKRDSPEPAERALAQRLCAAEARLLELGAQRGARVTLLRPTLVYGVGLDRNLSRIAELAQRWHGFVLPRDATGLRQPVHAEDVAQAARSAATRERPLAASYDLPGGETLDYREMVRRVLAGLSPPRRLWLLPPWLFRVVQWGARQVGVRAGAGLLARLREDLVYDATPARRDLDYAPRPFEPRNAMFVSPGA